MSFRVAVTTSADSYARWAQEVSALGHNPVALPCIKIQPRPRQDLERLRSAAVDAELLILTSARTVALLWPDGEIPDVPVAAVGPATADAARSCGGQVAVIGDAGGDDLVARITDGLANKRVVFPHAGGSDLSRVALLETAGAAVTAGAVYDSIPIAPPLDPVDATLFGSPSAVAGWSMSRSKSDAGLIGAIGTTTAAALVRDLDSKPVVPANPTVPALVAALSEALKGSHESVPHRS